VHKVQNLGNRLKLERAICLEKRNPIRAESEDFLEPRTQLIGLYCRLIDPDGTIRGDFHHDDLGWNLWTLTF
jgi:hypothetical protein